MVMDTSKLVAELLKKETSPKLETKSQKKRRVIAEGTKIQQVVCPLCSMNRTLYRHGERIRFDNFDFNRIMLQIRYAGGRDSGFYINEAESKTFDDIKDDPAYADLIAQIKATCKNILERIG
jgi:hypothetical protein